LRCKHTQKSLPLPTQKRLADKPQAPFALPTHTKEADTCACFLLLINVFWVTCMPMSDTSSYRAYTVISQ
jgi:hypothetical protein